MPRLNEKLRVKDFRPAEEYSSRAVPLAIKGHKPPPASDQDGSTDGNPIALPAQRSTIRAPSPSFHKPPPSHPDTLRTTATSFVYITPSSITEQLHQHITLSVSRSDVDAQAFFRPCVCFPSCIIVHAPVLYS